MKTAVDYSEENVLYGFLAPLYYNTIMTPQNSHCRPFFRRDINITLTGADQGINEGRGRRARARDYNGVHVR